MTECPREPLNKGQKNVEICQKRSNIFLPFVVIDEILEKEFALESDFSWNCNVCFTGFNFGTVLAIILGVFASVILRESNNSLLLAGTPIEEKQNIKSG